MFVLPPSRRSFLCCCHTSQEHDSGTRGMLLFKQKGCMMLSSEARTSFFTPDGRRGDCPSTSLCEHHGSVLVERTHGTERKDMMESSWLSLSGDSVLGVVSWVDSDPFPLGPGALDQAPQSTGWSCAGHSGASFWSQCQSLEVEHLEDRDRVPGTRPGPSRSSVMVPD